MIDKVYLAIFATKSAWSEATHTPSAHTVGTTAEIALFVGDDGGVAVGDSYTKGGVHGQRATLVEDKAFGIVKIEFGILRVGDVEYAVLSVLVGCGFE